MRILGLDISKSSVCACLLTERPTEPRQFFYDCKFYRFKADAAGIRAMLALEPDIAVMEPTGVNYSRLWGTHLARAGVPVWLVGHGELRSYRKHHLALPDKDDDADAMALACYWFDYKDKLCRFLQVREYIATRLRELVLRLAHLTRVRSPIQNRARQDLAWQFPEVALRRSRRSDKYDTPLLWGWLAGERPSDKYDKLYAKTVGLGITDTLRSHAKRICDLQREEAKIERELRNILAEPVLIKYLMVLALFGFGERISAVILSQIYPFKNYLDSSAKPDVKFHTGRNSGKPTKQHLSLRRFQKALGAAPTTESSGDARRNKIVLGSDLCRRSLWQWVNTRITLCVIG